MIFYCYHVLIVAGPFVVDKALSLSQNDFYSNDLGLVYLSEAKQLVK
jgi:hypothetical protein